MSTLKSRLKSLVNDINAKVLHSSGPIHTLYGFKDILEYPIEEFLACDPTSFAYSNELGGYMLLIIDKDGDHGFAVYNATTKSLSWVDKELELSVIMKLERVALWTQMPAFSTHFEDVRFRAFIEEHEIISMDGEVGVYEKDEKGEYRNQDLKIAFKVYSALNAMKLN